MADSIVSRVKLAYRIRHLRIEAGLTQAEMANRIGLSRTSITNIEDARQAISAEDLPSYAEALGVSVGDLYNWTACPTCGGTGLAEEATDE